jgi:nidogen (entactin)
LYHVQINTSRKIFWTDWDRKNPKIEWANADGTGRAVFLQGESVSLPNSLTIDYETEQLCYADAGTKKIECVDIDSKIKQTIATNCTYPFGITVTDKHIYWSDWIT